MKIYFQKIRQSVNLFILMCFFGLAGYAQKQPDIDRLFSDYQRKHLTEKIFMHIDKGFYLAGEILWFKAYCVDGVYNKPLEISKVAYVELLNEKMEPVLQAKIELSKGFGTGSLYLPGTLKTGNYQLRSYTSWMKNFDPAGYFIHNVKIVNTLEQVEQPTAGPIDQHDYTIGLYPEGGNLVSGLESKIAFQVYDPSGKGMDCEIEILNRLNEKITSAQSRKFGIGSFQFTPGKDGPYRAQVRLPSGLELSKEFPKIFDTGYVLSAQGINADEVRVIVSGSSKTGSLQLFVNQDARVIDKKYLTLREGRAEVLLKRQQLPEGIFRVTLFDHALKPQSERLLFQTPKEKLRLNLNSDKQSYAIRNKAKIELEISNVTDQSVRSDISMSVFRLDSLDLGEENSIATYLLFTSELKGHVESPEYYFRSGDAESIDNLLLTHGWRRFKWENVLDQRTISQDFLPEYLGHIITGKVINIQSNTPAVGISSYLSVPGKTSRLFISESDSAGKLLFYTRGINGPGEILLQNNYAVDSTYRIDIYSPYSARFTHLSIPPLHLSQSFVDFLNLRSVNVQATNIFKGNKLNQYKTFTTDTAMFYGLPTRKYKLDDYVRFTTMNEVITEYIAEVQVQRINRKSVLNVFDVEKHQRFPGGALILLDGLPVFDDEKILAFDPLKVKTIETVSKKYSIGAGYFDGIVNFATYKGDMQGFEVNPKATVMNYEGMQMQREFYSPRYSNEKEISSTIPDFRDLLYWNPSITTSDNGRVKVEFYTSDQTGTYMVVVNGISGDGCPFHKSIQFKVERGTL